MASCFSVTTVGLDGGTGAGFVVFADKAPFTAGLFAAADFAFAAELGGGRFFGHRGELYNLSHEESRPAALRKGGDHL